MALTPIKSIRATTTIFGSGPGMGGTSFIHFSRDGAQFRVLIGGTSGDLGPEEIGTVPETAGWRGRLQFLIDNADQPEEVLPEEVHVRGAKGVEAQMLALAWSGPSGASAARALLALGDDELSRLAGCGGVFKAADPYREMDEILGSDEAAITGAIRVALARPAFRWETALDEAKSVADGEEERSIAEAAAREAALAPFASDIDRLLKVWWRVEGGSTSTIHHWLMTTRQGAVRAFVEQHVLSYGTLPTGTHHLSFGFMNTKQYLSLDMDPLLLEIRSAQ